MNITFEKTDEVHGRIVAVVEPADYTSEYDKALKENARRLQLPGFRPGKTPVSLVKKRFGQEILIETVSKTLGEALDKYMTDEKVPVLLSPVADKANDEMELVEGGTFTFQFTLALKPQFDFALSSEDTLTYYDIEIPADRVEQQVNVYRRRQGKFDKVEDYQDNDMVRGTLTELDSEGTPLEEGILEENAVLLPYILKNDEQKALFNGAKLGDVLTINPTAAYNGNETEVAAFLHIAKEEAAAHQGNFQFQLTEISRYVPGDLNQELFNEVFPGKGIETEKQFTEAIKQQLSGHYTKESDFKFLIDMKHYAEGKVGELPLPEDMLRNRFNTEEGKSPEEADKEFASQLASLKWEIILDKLAEQFGVKVTPEDIVKGAHDQVREQYAQYGMIGIDEAIIDDGAKKLLQNHAQIEQLEFSCLNRMVAAAAKDIVTLDHKSVSIDEFYRLAQDKEEAASQANDTQQE